MGSETKSKRFIESWIGRMALFVLGLVWFFSMSGVDKNAYSALPVTIGVGVVALLIAGGVCSGYKLVRMSWLGWMSLVGVGGYFLVRCSLSYSVVEAWRESALILGCMMFYLMGVYAAQLKGYGWLYGVIAVAVLLNVLYFYFMNATDMPMVYTGRPEVGLTGVNTRPVTLFLYKNVAGLFLMLGGGLLINMAFFQRKWRWVSVLLGVSAIVLSCYCRTRVVYLVFPVLLVVSWLLQFLFRLYSERQLRWWWVVSGLVIFVVCSIFAFEFIFGQSLFDATMNIDTNKRAYVWKYGMKIAYDIPAWGCGASAFLWEILPIYDEWATPNYAHNEYLQVWMDYGIIGLLMMLGGLLLHIVNGVRAYISEQDSVEHRIVKALALLVVFVLAVCVFTDYIWHFYSMATMTAFCCGALASPFPGRFGSFFEREKWVSSGKTSSGKVVAQGLVGRGVIVMLCMGMLGYAAWLSWRICPAWMAQWEFAALCEPGKDEKVIQRHRIQARVINTYPDSAIMDYFYSLPLSEVTWEQQERLMKMVLQANPKNLFAVTMLGEVLSRQKKYQEAEALYRKYYSVCKLRDAMMSTRIRRWHTYYGYNLLLWGYQKMKEGDLPSAYSMMDYALNIHARSRLFFNLTYASINKQWSNRDGAHPEAKDFIKRCAKKVEMFRMLGVKKDDEWMSPMEEGGSRALYQDWGNTPRPLPKKSGKRNAVKKKG